MKILREREVVSRTGLNRVTIWRRERAGDFPARREIGPNSVGWIEDEIDKWIASRIKRSATATPNSAAA
jgi:prophage regulatory protein